MSNGKVLMTPELDKALHEAWTEENKRKVGRGRPAFGYTKDGTPILLEIQALEAVKQLLDDEAISLREGAEYIFSVCGRPISHVGLRDRLAQGILMNGRDS